MRVATALLELLASATGTGIVSTNLGLFATDGLLTDHLAVVKEPLVIDALELAKLVMFDLFIVDLIPGNELDRALGVSRAACFGADDLEPEPLGILGPLARFLHVVLVTRLGMVGLVDILDLLARVSGVPRAHQCLGSRRLVHAADERLAALGVDASGSAGARLHERRFCFSSLIPLLSYTSAGERWTVFSHGNSGSEDIAMQRESRPHKRASARLGLARLRPS